MIILKKIISVLLAVVILVNVLCVSVFAKPNIRPIEEVLREAIVNFEDSVDVSDYGYYVQEGGNNTLYRTAYYGVYQTYADTFHFDTANSAENYVYDGRTGLITEYKLNYVYTPEEVKEVKDMAEEYIFSRVDKSWTDLEKALFFHDFLCQNFQYDIRLFFQETQNDVARDIYRMFTEGMGVCQAYANTYEYLLQHEGIECKLVASDDSNHEWNIVKLDGEWYHVDVTQDDPLMAIDEYNVAFLDMSGSVSHKYFLLSDSAIFDHHLGGDHYNWYCTGDINRGTTPCISTKYDNGWLFRESNTAFCYVDDNWYYFRHNEEDEKAELVKTNNFKTGNVVINFDSFWSAAEPGYYYNAVYTGLSEVNGYLIYNTDIAVFAYDVKKNKEYNLFGLTNIYNRDDVITVGGEAVMPNNLHIYGSKADKDGVYCQLSQSPADYAYYIAVIPLCDYGHLDSKWVVAKEPTGWADGLEEKICTLCVKVIDSRVLPATGSGYPKGDTNFDGEVNVIDLGVLKKVVAGISEKADMDLNGDGKTDVIDLGMLKKFVAGLITEF